MVRDVPRGTLPGILVDFMISWAILSLVAGCNEEDTKGKEDPTSDTFDSPSTTDTSGTTDTGTTTGPPPCAAGTWGELDESLATTALWVAAGAGGDGSREAPYGTLAEAITASRAKGAPKVVFVLGGTYDEALDLDVLQGDDGLVILGCGSGEVTLAGDDDDLPIVRVSTAQGVVLRGFTLSGGRRSLWIWSGANVAAEDIVVTGSRRVGVVIDGSSSVALLSRVSVVDTLPDTAEFDEFGGFGIAVREAQVTLLDVSVTGAVENGVVIDGSSSVVSMSRVQVTEVASRADGRSGRGVQVQGLASMTLTDVEVSDCADAGIFGLGALRVDLLGVTVSNVVAADIAESDERSGDGIVLTDGAEDEDWRNRDFKATVTDVTVSGAVRAGILFAGNGLEVELAGANITPSTADPGGGLSLAQDDALVTGDLTFPTGDSPFAFDPTPVVTASLTD